MYEAGQPIAARWLVRSDQAAMWRPDCHGAVSLCWRAMMPTPQQGDTADAWWQTAPIAKQLKWQQGQGQPAFYGKASWSLT
jgi:hypothetical protein